ncbi:MAG: hypothetical protein WBD47_10700 [Phormidesmis sp.]
MTSAQNQPIFSNYGCDANHNSVPTGLNLSSAPSAGAINTVPTADPEDCQRIPWAKDKRTLAAAIFTTASAGELRTI